MLNEDISADLKNKVARGEAGVDSYSSEIEIIRAINTFASMVSNNAHNKGWWPPQGRNFGEMVALFHSELSEALEAWREGDNPQQIRYEYPTATGPQVLYAPEFVYEEGHVEIGKPVGVASEFADVIIRILDTCHTLKIPIAEALLRKHNYNKTRPHRHGGKLA